MDMTVKDVEPTLAEVALKGRLDSPGVDSIETRLTASLVPRGVGAIVDLSGVEFVGSMAIRMFISLARALTKKGHRLVLFAPQPLVQQVFETVALADIIPVAADRSAAVQAARG
jgi:anti-anti-sigma factor